MTPDPLDLPRRLIALGVPVWTAKPTGNPAVFKGYQPSDWSCLKADPTELDRYRPGDAVLMVTGHGLDLIDGDVKNGASGVQQLSAMQAAGVLPYTYAMQATPSGGIHRLVRSVGVGSRDGVRPGIDFKGGHNGVGHGLAFIHPTPGYLLVAGDTLDDFDPADDTGGAWADVVRQARSKTVQPVADVWELVKVGPRIGDVLPDGQQDAMLRDYAASVVARSHSRYSRDELIALVVAYGQGCVPPWGHAGGEKLAVVAAGKVDTALAKFLKPDDSVAHDDPVTVEASWQPVDWRAIWDEEVDEDWLCEPLIHAGRGTVLYSPAKMGKSLITLEIAANLACGRDALGFRPKRPIRVLVLDHENDPRSDTRQRLKRMGFQPADLDNLIVLSYPVMSPLDTREGGAQVLLLAERHGAELVVIDTVSRTVAGEENDNNTWLQFYRNTGIVLKRAGIAMLRLDHSGKDVTKGQRGGSAKTSDVDLVWSLSEVVKDETFQLTCTHNRMMVAERVIVLHREEMPLRHRVDAMGRSAAHQAKVKQIILCADSAGLPDDASYERYASAMKAAGLEGHGNKRENSPLTHAKNDRAGRSVTMSPADVTGKTQKASDLRKDHLSDGYIDRKSIGCGAVTEGVTGVDKRTGEML